MNKKDLKELGKAERLSPLPPPPAVFGVADFKACVEEVAKKLAPPSSRVLDRPWWDLYTALVGSQAGWLTSATDTDKLTKRLTALGQVATAAVNFAVNHKKLAK